MASQGLLPAVNNTIAIDISKYRNGAVQVTTSSDTAANATVVLEVNGVHDVNGTPEWLTIGMFDPVARASAANLTGASKSGWADVPGYAQVRVRRTDANGGICRVAIDHREG
jgi:hypothetical protein